MHSPGSSKNAAPLVTVYTQVYNTKPYLEQCIESVLSQTFADFEYILVDNGCTDGSSEILDRYAEEDRRIKLIRYEHNRLGIWEQLISENATGQYLSILDSDDWWEPDYLERLVCFSDKHHLDIACTGTTMHFLADNTQGQRKADRKLVIPRSEFANMFPWHHVFCRTTWGKLIRMDQAKKILDMPFPKLSYGGDTWWLFQLLRHAANIGIDDSVLHHYRVHKKSVSYQYHSDRFDADIFLYNDAIDFLAAYGPLSAQNRMFLQIVYSNALIDTFQVIQSAALTPAEKLSEYCRIATHPLTMAVYRECTDEAIAQSRNLLLGLTLQAGAELKGEDDTHLRVVVQTLLPNCGKAVTGQNLPLFLQNKMLIEYLRQDNAELLIQQLLAYIAENRYANLAKLVRALAVDKPLLCQIEDPVFLRKYGKLYLSVWRGETLSALEEMTGLLLEDPATHGKETFLQLYLSLAALEQQAPAFLFGKLRLAEWYLAEGRLEDCRAAVRELAEMGLENEEFAALCRELREGEAQP